MKKLLILLSLMLFSCNDGSGTVTGSESQERDTVTLTITDTVKEVIRDTVTIPEEADTTELLTDFMLGYWSCKNWNGNSNEILYWYIWKQSTIENYYVDGKLVREEVYNGDSFKIIHDKDKEGWFRVQCSSENLWGSIWFNMEDTTVTIKRENGSPQYCNFRKVL